MARKLDPLAKYRLSVHKLGDYLYASTQPGERDPETGKIDYRRKHWGRLYGEGNSLSFMPNNDFLILPPSERKLYIFPDTWDLSALNNASGFSSCGRRSQTRTGNRLYGDVWLLEKISERVGLKSDLNTVFDGNREMVDAILTLAMFPYLYKASYNRLTKWQNYARFPSEITFNKDAVRKITSSITSLHKDELFKLRSQRCTKGAKCAADSTTRGAYGDSLSDAKEGKSKSGDFENQTVELVVYDLTNHTPIYYRTFGGNTPDCRTLPFIINELNRVKYSNIILITDRGYMSLEALEYAMLKNCRIVSMIPTSYSFIKERIKDYGEFSIRPESMSLISNDDDGKIVYGEQFNQLYVLENNRGKRKAIYNFKSNIYLKPEIRVKCFANQELKINNEFKKLTKLHNSKEKIKKEDELKKKIKYFKYTLDNGYLDTFTLDEKKIEEERLTYGFFSIVTLGVDEDVNQTLETYRIRDEQEKYFQQMKSEMEHRHQGCSTEDGKVGREFILFVGLILSSYLRYIWKSTELKEIFDSSLAILDEMRNIRCIEEPGKEPVMSPFIGAQLKICECFQFEVPEKCAPGYKSKRIVKRGRPPKSKATK